LNWDLFVSINFDSPTVYNTSINISIKWPKLWKIIYIPFNYKLQCKINLIAFIIINFKIIKKKSVLIGSIKLLILLTDKSYLL